MTKNIDQITGFHAHVYYDADSKSNAENLRDGMEKIFTSALFGRWHDNPVGPHVDGSFQIAFEADLFADLMGYLALNRNGLAVLVHPETGDELRDHSDHAIWMGDIRPLDLSLFKDR